MKPFQSLHAVVLGVIFFGPGSLSLGDEKAKSKDVEQGTVHTVQASVGYPTNAGVGILAEKQPGPFTIPEGSKGAKLKYSFHDPKSGYTSTKLRGSNIYSVTEKRYMHELDKDPNFELPPGEYKFVVGGQPGALGNLTYTLAPTGPGPTKPPPPPPGKPPRKDKKDKLDKPPAPPLPPGGEEVLLLLPKNFDVLVPDWDMSKQTVASFPGSSRGANDGPLVLRFRDGTVTADQKWTAYLRQRGENPHIVEWQFRVKFNGTFRRGVLQGQLTQYWEEGIRAIRYPQSQEWREGPLSGQANADGKMTVHGVLKVLSSLWYDPVREVYGENENPEGRQASTPRFEIMLPVGQLQSTQKLSEPLPVPAIPAVK